MRGLVLLVGALVACQPESDHGTVRVGTDVDAESLDPRLTSNTTGSRVTDLLYDGLLQLDTMLEPVPNLARSWEHPDSVTWVFHLRDGVRFHNGSSLTASDVVYTFETIVDPQLRSPVRTLYAPIDKVEAPDDTTVEFTLSHPYAAFLKYLDLGIVPKNLLLEGHNLSRQPVGSGPYGLSGWNKGSKITLVANEHYWKGKPNVPNIEIVLVADNTARAQSFEAGDLDLIQSPLAPPDVERLAADTRFSGETTVGIAITYLNFNTAVPVLNDPRMRRALAMLVDQKTIVGEIYQNMDRPATSIFPPSSWAHTDDVRQPQYDPERARRILGQMGWHDSDNDGFLDKNGKKLTVRLGTHSEDVNRVQTIEFLQHSFAESGVDVRVEISDWASFSARRNAGDYEIILLGWTQIVDPDRVTFEQLHSSGGLNWGKFANATLDSLLERGRSSERHADRVAAYHAAARLIASQVPYYIISYQGYQVFYDSRIRGFEPNPRGRLRSLARSTIVN
ncbi:MAG: ABC transporter substrate-binding protein [Gemmatimonadales bacterium]